MRFGHEHRHEQEDDYGDGGDRIEFCQKLRLNREMDQELKGKSEDGR